MEFETKEVFQASNIPSILKSVFSFRSDKLSNNETFNCKYMREKGHSCKVKIRMIYSESSEQVEVKQEGAEHSHDNKYCPAERTNPTCWRRKQILSCGEGM